MCMCICMCVCVCVCVYVPMCVCMCICIINEYHVKSLKIITLHLLVKYATYEKLYRIVLQMVLRVGVIGAGAAGLVALRHLLARPEKFHAIAFELSSCIGGTWVYTEKTHRDENGEPVHSSMYKNLV